MLTALGERARSRGWIVVAETATAGLLARLTAEIARQIALVAGKPKRGVSAVTSPSALGFSLGSVTLGPRAPAPAIEFRTAAGLLLDQLEQHETGLLVTVDESTAQRLMRCATWQPRTSTLSVTTEPSRCPWRGCRRPFPTSSTATC